MFIPFTEAILKDELYFNEFFISFKNLFTSVNKKTNQLGTIEIKFDWTILEDAIIDFKASGKRIRFEIPIIASYNRFELKLIQTHNLLQHYIEVIIYDIFLIMNLSHPGCFSIFNVILKVIPDYEITFRIDDMMFSTAMYTSLNRNGVNISNIELSRVYKWYNTFSNIDN